MMTLKYNKFKCYWTALTEKKTSYTAQILNEKSAFSQATVVFEK